MQFAMGRYLAKNNAGFFRSLYSSALSDGKWKVYAQGLVNTLLMTCMALVIGLTLGVLVALIKSQQGSYRDNIKAGKQGTGAKAVLRWVYRLLPLQPLADLYTTIIRGTPVVLQILIIYYYIFAFAPREARLLIASLAFGINSGAYVSEIIRGGILSIGKGQMEAGRSLGLSRGKTMRLIILPQAIRNIIPAIFNEFIALVKETSVAKYAAVIDITAAGDSFRTEGYALQPLLVSAMLYLVLVIGLTQLQKFIEKRLSAHA